MTDRCWMCEQPAPTEIRNLRITTNGQEWTGPVPVCTDCATMLRKDPS